MSELQYDPLHVGPCVAIAGGVGGARLADGLYRSLAADSLTVIVNTGDDFEHFGLTMCPDLDTVMYTLAGLANPETGWGVVGDTTHALAALRAYGADDWFIVGDRDLATHVRRTALLHSGHTLTQATASLVDALGIRARLLPMTDAPVPTFVHTQAGERLTFQDYFVRRRHQDAVARVEFAQATQATLTHAISSAVDAAETIVFCPSNPFLSIEPILSVPGLRARIAAARARKIGVSPIIGGAAVKGPAADMLTSLGHDCSALGVARLYAGLLDVLVIDEVDAALAPAVSATGLRCVVTPSLMRSIDDRVALARRVLEAAHAPEDD